MTDPVMIFSNDFIQQNKKRREPRFSRIKKGENQGGKCRQTSFFYYYEMIKRELNERLLYECRCDERLNSKPERSTCLSYTVSVFTVSLFIINRESESYRENLNMSVGVMKD